ncbi:alginate lyase family protein [Pararobbsia alpina]|uniref:alginate lyase family protein n=1 Tax=Pararobbsia alpina TaxID=621374 RepID=UPI003CCDB0C8
MVSKILARQVRAIRQRYFRMTLGAAFAAGVLLSTAAQAAMNFCAAPALQNGEREDANSSVHAMIVEAQTHMNDVPHPLPRLHTEGTLPHEGIHDESVVAERELDLMRDTALAWRATADPRFLKMVDRFLLAWVKTYTPSFNPIDESHFDSLILAYDLTASALSASTRNATINFLQTLGNGYITRIDNAKRPLDSTFSNNWQSHRVKLIAMSAFALDDRKMIEAARRLFASQLQNNIGGDGQVLDYDERDAIHYVVYDLEPLTMAALAARRHRIDWLTQRAPNGATLQAALNWLVPYATGKQSHDEFVHSKVPFDGARRDAGVPGFGGPWDPKNAATLFYLASRLDKRYLPVAQHLAAKPPAWLGVCLPTPE